MPRRESIVCRGPLVLVVNEPTGITGNKVGVLASVEGSNRQLQLDMARYKTNIVVEFITLPSR